MSDISTVYKTTIVLLLLLSSSFLCFFCIARYHAWAQTEMSLFDLLTGSDSFRALIPMETEENEPTNETRSNDAPPAHNARVSQLEQVPVDKRPRFDDQTTAIDDDARNRTSVKRRRIVELTNRSAANETRSNDAPPTHNIIVPSDNLLRVMEMQEQFYKQQAHTDYETKHFKKAEEIIFDPLRNKRVSSGDEKLKNIMKSLDSFGIDRTQQQRLFHKWFLRACLPHIYGDEWKADSSRILASHGLTSLRAEVFVATPRRFGKTWAVAMFLSALCLNITGKSIAVFSKTIRQSGALTQQVKEFIARIPGAMDRVVEDNKERFFLATEDIAIKKREGVANATKRIPHSKLCRLFSLPGSSCDGKSNLGFRCR